MVIQSGEATLVVGGKVIEPNTIEAGEIRGKSIEGGVKKKIMQGDVIHIPAGAPHQFLLRQAVRLPTFFSKLPHIESKK
jgi:hypothetical protein